LCDRGTDSKRDHADRYIGRGITVCAEWLGPEGFAAFFAHIGPKPDPSYTVERIDNDKGYEPGNVRWATRAEQNQNKEPDARSLLTALGETMTYTQWGERSGLKADTIYQRIKLGWNADEAVTRKTCRGKKGRR
jgi:hypothetical protein